LCRYGSGAVLTMYAAGAAVWPSEAVRAGAMRAAEALGGGGEGAAMAAALAPAERVALTAALACVAVDSEAMRGHLLARLEGAISAHKLGLLPLAPKKVKPKPPAAVPQATLDNFLSPAKAPAAGGEDVKETAAEGAAAGDSTPAAPATPTPAAAAAARPEWAESLIEWVAKAADRSVYLRGRAIATDEKGRRYHTLGGSAGAGLVFVEKPVEGADGIDFKEKDAAVPVKQEAGAGAGGGGDDADAMDVDGGGGGGQMPEHGAAAAAGGGRAAVVRGKAVSKALAEADGFGAWPTTWSCFAVGPGLKSLKEWLDDDPRNPAGSDERRLKSLSSLLMRTAPKAAAAAAGAAVVIKEEKGGEAAAGGDVEMKTEDATGAGAAKEKKVDGFEQFGLLADGYAHLDSLSSGGGSGALSTREQRNAAATALCSVVRFVLSGSTKFWTQKPQWLVACLNLFFALPDALGTGVTGVAAGDNAGDRLAVLVARVLPPLEAMLRTSSAMQEEWIERREAWFTGLRGAEDFDLRVPPPELMSYEEAEAAVAAASAVAADAIEWSTSDEALDSALRLSVARSARLLATLCSALSVDTHRLTLTGFLAATPPATHPGIKVCKPGGVVALLRKVGRCKLTHRLESAWFQPLSL
jgi:hypothetical protein